MFCTQLHRISGTGKGKSRADKYEAKTTPVQYNPSTDFTLGEGRKRKREEESGGGEGVMSGYVRV